MRGMIQIRPVTSDEWSVWRTMRLRALAEAPAAFSSTLAQWQDAGDTEARWRQRLDSVPFNVLAWQQDDPVGMVSGVRHDDGAELISLWVDPPARGSGVGAALIRAVVDWAATEYIERIELCVMERNEAVMGLYQRHGFVEAECHAGSVDGQRHMVRHGLT
jgi:ribosomal protein S18 acetylase RimI-like enzyme